MSFQYPGEVYPSSLNPPPDVYPADLTDRELEDIKDWPDSPLRAREERRIRGQVADAFWLDMGLTCNSAAAQCCAGHDMHDSYIAQARDSRARLEQYRAIEARLAQNSIARFFEERSRAERSKSQWAADDPARAGAA